jgi:predicted nucleotidyltransferase
VARARDLLPGDIAQRLETLGLVLERECPAVAFAYVFGSLSRGEHTLRSDVDLAVFVAPDADLQFNRLEVARVAAKHLGTDSIDVVLLNTAPVALAGRVLTSRQVLLDRRPFLRHEYESRTARLFHDFRIHEHNILSHRYDVRG